jgi:hypothetical protein
MHHGFLYDQVKLYLPLKLYNLSIILAMSSLGITNFLEAARKALKQHFRVLLEELILQYSLELPHQDLPQTHLILRQPLYLLILHP